MSKSTKINRDEDPKAFYEDHLKAIEKLIKLISDKAGEDKATYKYARKINWGDVSQVRAARESLAEAAFYMDALAAEDAKRDHGVSI